MPSVNVAGMGGNAGGRNLGEMKNMGPNTCEIARKMLPVLLLP